MGEAVILRALVEMSERLDFMARRQLSREDRRLATVLLPLLDEQCGRASFSAAELLASTLNTPGPDSAALRELLADASEGGDPRALGWFFASIEGVTFSGLRLVDAGSDRMGRRWRIVR